MLADFHTHILPGIDDGSSSLEESIRMLKEESAMGIKHVVLTPHFYAKHDSPERFLSRRNEAYRLLEDEVKKYSDLPMLHLGAEVHYFDGIGHWDGLKDLSIDHSGYVLIEMPMSSWTSRMYKELEDIYHYLGLVPVIAHIDRYLTPFHTSEMMRKLSQLPVFIQANGSFFMKSMTSRAAMKLLSQDLIHVIGSDCHNMTSRPPNLDEVKERIEDKLGKEVIETINMNTSHILGIHIEK